MTIFRNLTLMLTVLTLLLASPFAAAEAKKERQKVIDFEEELVEGMNKRPLDSLASLSEKNKRKKKPHLYRKRAGFRPETSETVRELRYIQ